MDLSEKLQKYYSDKTPLSSPEYISALKDLCKKVYFRFFRNHSSYKEDLLSEGLVKALSLIQSGRYNPQEGSLLTFLFTGIRNSMTNYAARIREEPFEGEYDWDGLVDLQPAGHYLDLAEAQSMFKSSVSFAGYVLCVMEGRIMMDLWRNVSEADKKLFAKLVDRNTSLEETEDLVEKCGDLVLWCMFVFAGQTVKFPTSMVLSRLLRQAQVYNMRSAGMSEKEVGRKVGLRRAHIQRIYDDVKEIIHNEQKSTGTDTGTDSTTYYTDRGCFSLFG